ncbi:MAG: hypothetical protein ABII07_01785 [Patescibacteria group bacterium]|nr:hypothetical protein [Patescibacteria group bacterium]
MKKATILLAVLFLSGCFLSQQAVTFTTPAYSYIEPGVDTIDFTTTFETNAYLSRVVCADEETLDTQGPALMSAYAKPTEAVPATSFNLTTDKLNKFAGSLCDIYVMAYDETTVEETEAVVRVNIGAAVVVVEEDVVIVEDAVCDGDDEEECDDEEVEEEAEEALEE